MRLATLVIAWIPLGLAGLGPATAAATAALAASARARARAWAFEWDTSPTTVPSNSTQRQALADGTCAIEQGVDYLGNDIGSVLAPTPGDCCAKCEGWTGCGAFTWSSYNGGTCWLKSKKTGSVANGKTHSAVLAAANPGTCRAEPGTDYIGNDIGNIAGINPEACCAKCSQIRGCKAYSWSDYLGGTCWLKSTRGAVKAAPNVHSGEISASPTPTPPPSSTPVPQTSTPPTPGACSTLEKGVDYAGNDIGNTPSTTVQDCCSRCSKRLGCGAFTWTPHNGGTCWLKSWRGKATPAGADVVTGTVGHIQPRIRTGEVPAISVSLGSWLVAEYWMSYNSPAWNGHNNHGPDGEFATMKYLGRDRGTAQFEQHRSTWITEADIQEISRAGLNAVRVPVGFWIMYDDPSIPSTDISRVYAPGSLKYLDKLIDDWAIKYNLAVMISLHAHQGSQNGYDHSAPQEVNKISWGSSRKNIDNSVKLAAFLADRYKTSVAFLGLGLMNEPRTPTTYDNILSYYREAYQRIRATGNNCVLLTSPLLPDQRPPYMMDFLRYPEYTNVWQEFHAFFKWSFEGKSRKELLDYVATYRPTHLEAWTGNWVHVAAWSLAAPNSAALTERSQMKQYGQLQLDQYRGAHSGWSFWSWRHDDEKQKLSEWSLRQLLKEGVLNIS